MISFINSIIWDCEILWCTITGQKSFRHNQHDIVLDAAQTHRTWRILLQIMYYINFQSWNFFFFANISQDFRKPHNQALVLIQFTCKHYCKALHLHVCKTQQHSVLWNESHGCVPSVNRHGEITGVKMCVGRVDSSRTAWKVFNKVHLL